MEHKHQRPEPLIIDDIHPIDTSNLQQMLGAWVKIFFFPILVSAIGTLIMAQVNSTNNDIKEMRGELNIVLRNPILQMSQKDIVTSNQFEAYCKLSDKITQEIQTRNLEAINQLRIDIRNSYIRTGMEK